MKKGSRTSLNGSEWRSPNTFWRASTKLSANLYTVIVRLPWVIAIVVISTIVIQGLTQSTTVIKDISVPKTLAEAGYTADVAGHRMRDALYEFKQQARTQMRRPEVALAGELPTIVVPTVGISLDAIVSSLRTVFRSTRSRTITGEITINKDLLWLVLRIDGEKFYQSEVGVALGKPDDLFKAAAFDVMKKIKPYLAVVSLTDEKPEAALLVAQQTLARMPRDDEDIAWLHNLRAGIYLYYLKDNLKAAEAIKLALGANSKLSVVRVNHGVLLERLGRGEEATAEFLMAVRFDQGNPIPHLELGDYYKRQKKIDAAIAEYQKAIDLDTTDAGAHAALGLAFASKENFDGAIAEFQKVVDLEPKSAAAHVALGLAFASKENFDGAIAEFQKVVDLEPKNVVAHNGLGLAFAGKANFDAAIAEFQKAIELDSNDAATHRYLGLAFASKGNFDAAIPEYQQAIDLDPTDTDNFDAAIAEYEHKKAIALDPKDARTHTNLGNVFKDAAGG